MTKIQLRRDTAANWTSLNPVLTLGEPGYDITSGELRIGNGVAAWVALPRFLTGTGGAGGGLDTEGTIDAVAAALVAGANVTLTYNDAAGTITIAAAGGAGGGLDTEQVLDAVAASLVAGTGVTIAYNDAANTITISSTGGGGGTSLPDPNVDAIRFWDDSAGAEAYLSIGTGLQISGTTLNSTAAAGTATSLDIEMVGGYYNFPASLGTGVIRVNLYGPVAHSSTNIKIAGTASATLPSYIGLGAGKARVRWNYDTEVG